MEELYPSETLDFEPRAVLTNVIETLSEPARAKQLDLLPLIYDNVPSRLRGDSGRLRYVLSYLVSNAVRFTNRGQIVVSLTRDRDKGTQTTLRCAVSDTGIGITPEAQRHLFDREENDSGLTLVRQLVECMDGSIGIESAAGQGATFWFTARFEKVAEDASDAARSISPAQTQRQAKSKSPARSQVRVLVAEDNVMNQQITLHHLAKLGYAADVAANGEEVLQAVAKIPYDVVLMDCQMPCMNGYEATAEIRHRENETRHTVIIALTADASELNREKCLAVGMDDFLSKPVKRKDLATRLQQWTHDATTPEVNTPAELGHQLIPLFLRDAPTRIESMRAALSVRDARALEQAAHTLKSSSALLGASHMAELCEMLEAQGESGSVRHADDALRQLEDEFACVRQWLEAKMQSTADAVEAN